MLTLIRNTDTTLCAGCPDTVDITMPDLSPYRAGDVLTCSSDGYPAPTYSWTVGGVAGSTTSTQALQEGVNRYVCTATAADGTCALATAIADVTAYSKYHKRYSSNNTYVNGTAVQTCL